MAEQRRKAKWKTGLEATSRKKRRAANRVVIEIIGNNDVKTERLVWINAEDYISLENSEEIVWKDPNKAPYVITFTGGNCPLHDHQQGQEKFHLTVPANGERRGDIVRGEKGQRFDFTVLQDDGHRGTPRIIIQGKTAALDWKGARQSQRSLLRRDRPPPGSNGARSRDRARQLAWST